MKILGVGNGLYICSCTGTELGKISGYSSVTEWHKKKIGVGDEISVDKIFDRLTYLSKNQDKLVELADLLYKHADQLVLFDPVIKGIEVVEP
jgi:hypothetical protein